MNPKGFGSSGNQNKTWKLDIGSKWISNGLNFLIFSDVYPFLELACLEGSRIQSKEAISAMALLMSDSDKLIFDNLCEVFVQIFFFWLFYLYIRFGYFSTINDLICFRHLRHQTTANLCVQ